jgi:tetratricopeptide (TPR) repeat protein
MKSKESNLSDRNRRRYLKLALNHAQRAASSYQEMTTIDNVDDVISLLIFLIENHFIDQAISMCEELRRKGLSNHDMDILLAECYESQNQENMALDIWRDLSTADPYNYHFHIRQGQLFMRGRRLEDAILTFESAYRLKPNPQLAYELSRLYLMTNKPEKALKYIQLAPQNRADTDIMLAYIYQDLNQPDNALNILNDLVFSTMAENRTEPDERFYVAVATAYFNLKNKEKTIEALEHGLMRFPDNAELNNFLGYYLADENVQLGRAESHIRKALAATPYNPAYLDSLAWVYYRQGKFREAAFYIERTIGLQENHKIDGVILDHAGDIYHALDMTEKALFFWREALKNSEINSAAIAAKIKGLEGTR